MAKPHPLQNCFPFCREKKADAVLAYKVAARRQKAAARRQKAEDALVKFRVSCEAMGSISAHHYATPEALANFQALEAETFQLLYAAGIFTVDGFYLTKQPSSLSSAIYSARKRDYEMLIATPRPDPKTFNFMDSRSATELLRFFNAVETIGINSARCDYIRVYFAKGFGPLRHFVSPYSLIYEIPRHSGGSKLASYRAFFEENLELFLSKEDAAE